VTDLIDNPVGAPRQGRVVRVDALTGRLEDLIAVGARPSGIASGGGFIWVANGGDTTISKIDPRTNQVVAAISTRYHPLALTYRDGFLWVSLHREPFSF
jgi:YVTN family beta-propeller protein